MSPPAFFRGRDVSRRAVRPALKFDAQHSNCTPRLCPHAKPPRLAELAESVVSAMSRYLLRYTRVASLDVLPQRILKGVAAYERTTRQAPIAEHRVADHLNLNAIG